MLGYLLAVLVGSGSVGLYIAAFFFPEIHRKPDFIWGGVGLFYALALWIYAKEISGGILVGQAASVALLGWFGWQTIKLRQLVPIDWQTALPLDRNSARVTAKPANPAKTTATTSSEPKSPSASPTVPVLPKQASARPEISTSPPPKQPPTRIVPTPSIEQDEEAWIKLEVKPAPDATRPIREVGRSTSVNLQPPQQVRPQSPTASTQPVPAIQPPPPPPPPAKPQTLQETVVPSAKPEPAIEVITFPSPPPTSTAIQSTTLPTLPTPPALLSAAKPLLESTPSPTAPSKNPETISAATDRPPSSQITEKIATNPPGEQTGDLDRLIADLESEI